MPYVLCLSMICFLYACMSFVCLYVFHMPICLFYACLRRSRHRGLVRVHVCERAPRVVVLCIRVCPPLLRTSPFGLALQPRSPNTHLPSAHHHHVAHPQDTPSSSFLLSPSSPSMSSSQHPDLMERTLTRARRSTSSSTSTSINPSTPPQVFNPVPQSEGPSCWEPTEPCGTAVLAACGAAGLAILTTLACFLYFRHRRKRLQEGAGVGKEKAVSSTESADEARTVNQDGGPVFMGYKFR